MDFKNQPGQHAQIFQKEVVKQVSLSYLLFLPEGHGASESWPLMLFLHGMGERGNDLEMVKKHGPPRIVEQQPEFRFVVVSPQCPENERWQTDELMALVEGVVAQYAIDETRIYVTGLSMGGYGTWLLAGEHPERFAAIAPICGGGSRHSARSIAEAKLPVWVFHGAEDPTVPIEESQRMVDMIQRFGSEAKFTIYPEAQHDSWTETYDDPELYDWLLSHQRET